MDNVSSTHSLESINESKFQPLTEDESKMLSGGGPTVGVTLSLFGGPDVSADYSFE